jgi:hypothetical protein
MSRLVLWLGAVLFVPFGLWVLSDPTALAAINERPLPTATALTDSRAVDGGLVLGLGLFFLACALDPTKTRAGLLAMLLVGAGPFLGRCVGVVLDGGTAATYRVAALELGLAVLAAVALARQPNPLGGRTP